MLTVCCYFIGVCCYCFARILGFSRSVIGVKWLGGAREPCTLLVGCVGLGVGVVPPLGMEFGGFPCSVPPKWHRLLKRGWRFWPTPLANHTAYAVECPTRTKKQPNPESSSGTWEAALSGEKTGARGLKKNKTSNSTSPH